MLKATFKNIIFYIIIKDILFYVFLMFKNSNFKLIELENVIKGYSLMYVAMIIVPFTLFKIVIFTKPIQMALNLNKTIFAFALFVFLLLIEYSSYVYMTSQQIYDINGSCLLIIDNQLD